MSRALIWFRNDLRLHDNEPLHVALAEHDEVLPVYIFDPRHYQMIGEDPPHEKFIDVPLGFRKTGIHRHRFLVECLTDLRNNLQDRGGELLITKGLPETIIPELVKQYGITAVYAQQEIASEETEVSQTLEQHLAQADVELNLIWGRTMRHPADVEFPFDETPEPFKMFRRATSRKKVREPFPTPERVPVVKLDAYGTTLTAEQIGFTDLEINHPAASEPLALPGGETAALARLEYYTFGTDLAAKYKSTRNKSHGLDYSTKFSPYLAYGCLSPRTVYQRVKAYENENKKNRSTYWIIFEMQWRDFFQYQGMKYGDRMFYIGGLKGRKKEWQHDVELFKRWQEGRTGIPFLDAHQRQLAAEGFMSNRGRVNSASFFTRDYELDWRWGAAWLESQLIDFDVCSNWINWHTQAYEIYYTNPTWQGLKYDKDGTYTHHWLPELRDVPAPLIHALGTFTEAEAQQYGLDFAEDYPRPRRWRKKWNWALARINKAAGREATKAAEEE